MATSSKKQIRAQSLTLQLYNDHLARAVDVLRQGKPKRLSKNSPNVIVLHDLLDQINGDVEAYIDLFVDQAVQLGSNYRVKRVVSTWSHFLRASGLAKSRPIMRMVSVPVSGSSANQ
jgi:hypothetical protein